MNPFYEHELRESARAFHVRLAERRAKEEATAALIAAALAWGAPVNDRGDWSCAVDANLLAAVAAYRKATEGDA